MKDPSQRADVLRPPLRSWTFLKAEQESRGAAAHGASFGPELQQACERRCVGVGLKDVLIRLSGGVNNSDELLIVVNLHKRLL